MQSSKPKIIITVVLLVFIFLLSNATGVSKEIKNYFYLISSPVQKILRQTGQKIFSFTDFIFNIKSIKERYEELSRVNQEILGENARLKEIEKENETLRTALDIGLKKDFSLSFAEIIGKDAINGSILTDKGSKDGVLTNMPVITKEKFLCGKVGEVYDDFSKITLIFSKDIVFDVKIQSDKDSKISEPRGLAKGNEDSLIVDLLPADREIKEGDKVLTSSAAGVFPNGILVGEIEKISKNAGSQFNQARIKPFCDAQKLENFFIILRQNR